MVPDVEAGSDLRVHVEVDAGREANHHLEEAVREPGEARHHGWQRPRPQRAAEAVDERRPDSLDLRSDGEPAPDRGARVVDEMAEEVRAEVPGERLDLGLRLDPQRRFAHAAPSPMRGINASRGPS